MRSGARGTLEVPQGGGAKQGVRSPGDPAAQCPPGGGSLLLLVTVRQLHLSLPQDSINDGIKAVWKGLRRYSDELSCL